MIKNFSPYNFSPYFPFGQGKTKVPVAVKILKDYDHRNQAEFLKEAATMGGFRHKHIVRLFGVVTGDVVGWITS